MISISSTMVNDLSYNTKCSKLKLTVIRVLCSTTIVCSLSRFIVLKVMISAWYHTQQYVKFRVYFLETKHTRSRTVLRERLKSTTLKVRKQKKSILIMPKCFFNRKLSKFPAQLPKRQCLEFANSLQAIIIQTLINTILQRNGLQLSSIFYGTFPYIHVETDFDL